MKTRDQSESERLRAVAWIERAHARVAEAADHARSSFLAMTGHEIRMPLIPVLSLATALLVTQVHAQPRMPVEAIFESGDNLLYALNDTLDLSRLETARLELEQRGFSAETLVDQTFSMADAWSDQQALGLWVGDFSSDRADIFWHDADVMPAPASMDGFNVPSADNVGFNPGATWQAHETLDFHGDDMPASWLTDGFDPVSDHDAGFTSATAWQDIQPYYDLV